MAQHTPLIEILQLDRIEKNVFRGGNADVGYDRQRIFGGQVIAQALMAAYQTIERRICHSLHCYFIRPGDQGIPVLYDVERARDGRSFSTRRVIAIQNGEQIFNLSASFQEPEEGLNHQEPMPDAPAPEACGQSHRINAIEIRAATAHNWADPKPAPARQQTWFRAHGDFGGNIAMNQAVLAYASDMSLLTTSLLPHGVSWMSAPVQMASLDHALWFHRPIQAAGWHLYDQECPSTSGARGFARGLIYAQDGTLVASACQEGLIRLRSKRAS